MTPNRFQADDCQLLLWDITQPATRPSSSSRSQNSPRGATSPSSSSKKAKVLADPVLAYTAPAEITNMCWSPQIAGMTMTSGHSTAPGEWVAIAMGRSIKALKV